MPRKRANSSIAQSRGNTGHHTGEDAWPSPECETCGRVVHSTCEGQCLVCRRRQRVRQQVSDDIVNETMTALASFPEVNGSITRNDVRGIIEAYNIAKTPDGSITSGYIHRYS